MKRNREMSRERYERMIARTRAARMKWWHAARFGMFVHWGPYALIGRNEWVMDIECVPVRDYEKLADSWRPKPRPMREWARLARAAGMRYMVMTAKHLDGFCLWDSALTDYNAARRGPGRDLVREYVEACREFGLRIGLYFSVVDWHYRPTAAEAVKDPAARQRLVAYAQGCVRELMSNYGRIDVLWYDTGWPLPDAAEHSLRMNRMARELQPGIIINDRAMLPEDFSTPEGRVAAAPDGRGWEACMTFNDVSWGYMPSAAEDSHDARGVLKMLNAAAAGGGNLLLNIGPAPDGSVPGEVVEPLKKVGRWLKRNGEAFFGCADRFGYIRPSAACGGFSRNGNCLYAWVRYWPGTELPLGGFETKLRRASFLATGKPIRFSQSPYRIVLQGLPASSPDQTAGVTIIKLEFAGEPRNKVSVPWELRAGR